MRYIAFLLLGLLSLPSYAATKVDVYRAEVVLDENATDAEEVARQQGLQQVVVRASGDKLAAGNPVIVKALRQSGEFLSQIGYGTRAEQQTLNMVFNAPQIRSLLTQAQLPFWSEERSGVLVWIVEDSGYGREIVWEQSEDNTVSQLKYFAGLRGLPVTVPVGDIEDVTGITPPELWGGFVQSVGRASARYPADAVLVLRISGDEESSRIRYTLYDENPAYMATSSQMPQSGEGRGTLAAALESVVDDVSNYFAHKGSVQYSGESSGAVVVQILGIHAADEFFALEKQIEALNAVAGVDLLTITGDEITLRVHLLTVQENFISELLQFNKLRKFEMDTAEFIPAPVQLPENDLTAGEVTGAGVTDENSTAVPTASADAVPVSAPQTGVFVSNVQTPETDVQPDDTAPLVFEWVR